jgi:hypothetical protein
MKNMMFPGDNPFAYPNQPISTLEGASQFMTRDLTQDGFTPGSETEPFGMAPRGMPQPPLDPFNVSMLNNNLAMQHFAQQQGRLFSTPMSGNAAFSMSPMVEEPRTMAGMPMVTGAPLPPPEDYWTQLQKTGSVGMRSGLTPGGVDLDVLFGAGGEVWGGGMWNGCGQQGWRA